MRVLTDPEAKKEVILQMINGVKEIHSLGYTHMKICPENFLISKDLKIIKLADFEDCYNKEECDLFED